VVVECAYHAIKKTKGERTNSHSKFTYDFLKLIKKIKKRKNMNKLTSSSCFFIFVLSKITKYFLYYIYVRISSYLIALIVMKIFESNQRLEKRICCRTE